MQIMQKTTGIACNLIFFIYETTVCMQKKKN